MRQTLPRSYGSTIQESIDTAAQVLTVRVPSSRLQTLLAQPLTLLYPPGPDCWINLENMTLYFHPGTDAFTSVWDLAVTTGPGGLYWYGLGGAGLLDQTVDTIAFRDLSSSRISGSNKPAADFVHQPLQLVSLGDAEITGNAAGDAHLTVRLTYHLYNIF